MVFNVKAHAISSIDNIYRSRTFMKIIGVLLLNFFICLSAFAQTDESALKMVKSLRIGENLMSMSYQAALLTTTQQGIAKSLGVKRANEVLKEELSITVPKYQDEWNRNLAQAYSGLLTPEEFESLAVLKQQSPYMQKFLAARVKAGTAMQAKSKDLLIKVVSEALNSSFRKSTDKK